MKDYLRKSKRRSSSSNERKASSLQRSIKNSSVKIGFFDFDLVQKQIKLATIIEKASKKHHIF